MHHSARISSARAHARGSRKTTWTYELALRVEPPPAQLRPRVRVPQRAVVDPARCDRRGRRRVHDARRPVPARLRSGEQRGQEQLREIEVPQDVHAELRVVALHRELVDGRHVYSPEIRKYRMSSTGI